MKKILSILFSLALWFSSFGQMGSTLDLIVPINAGGSQTIHAAVWLPGEYGSTTKNYPVLLYAHGAGEACSDAGRTAGTCGLNTIYNNSSSGGPGYYITHSAWPDSFYNATNSTYYKFIVISPQAKSWSITGDQMQYILEWLIANYRCDINRIYGIGFSAGGQGVFQYAAHQDGNDDAPTGGNDHIRPHPLAGMILFAAATDATVLTGQKIAGDTTYTWGHGDEAGDIHGEHTHNIVNSINAAHTGYATYTDHPGTGHGGSAQWANPTYSGSAVTSFTGNVYKFLLQFAKNSPVPPPAPTVGAGADFNVNLPTTTATLTGTVFAGGGQSVASTTWTQISGPTTSTISTPSSLTTNISGLALGIYYYQLSMTNTPAGVVTKDTVQVTVSSTSYSMPTITVGGNATITSPTSTANITSSASYNGSAQVSFSWYPLLKPAQTKVKVAVLGSSTAAGNGATTYDSSCMGRYRLFGIANSLFDSLINFAVSGYNPYQAMPTGFVPNGTVTTQLSPQDVPDVAHNITAALNRGCNFFIINFPTNGFDVLSYANLKIPFQKFADTLTSLGFPYYFTTTQPRSDATFSTQVLQDKLKSIHDSLISWFPGHVIEFYTNVTIPGTTQKLAAYEFGDNIHLNNLGHLAEFNNMVGAHMFSSNASGVFSITSATSNNTSLTGLTNGISKVQATATDSRGQSISGVITITRNGGSVIANAGADQSITLPTSSVTLSASGSTGATTYLWTFVSGPSTPTITTPTTVSTTVTGLIQGVYVIQLQINGSPSFTDQVQITVNPAAVVGCGGAKYILPAYSDSSVYIDNTGNVNGYNPGDSLVLPAFGSTVDLLEIHGTKACPIVIVNPSNAVAKISKHFSCENCTGIKMSGGAKAGTFYGILIEQDPVLVTQNDHAIHIHGKSKNIEIDSVFMHNVDGGIVYEGDDDQCDTTHNYPNWKDDSINIHHVKILHTWNEGMYIGNTSPDNAAYDQRPVVCNGTTYYYKPAKNGQVRIWNNIVDSTGRGGIQVSNAEDSVDIGFNIVKHNGMNGDDAQGTAIVTGLYTHAYIHDNTISNTYTWGIASIGGCKTNKPIRIENNTVDSSGYLLAYDLATTNRTSYNPNTEPIAAPQLNWPQSILIDTRPRALTTDSPAGTGVPGQDSTQFTIKNNTLGLKKNSIAIAIENNYGGMQTSGNTICNNLSFAGVLVNLSVWNGINYNSSCAIPPVAHCPAPCYIFNR